MSKESGRTTEISVIHQPDVGVRLVTTTTIETSQLFASPDDALDSKDTEAHLKKGTGFVLCGIGIVTFLSSFPALGTDIFHKEMDRAVFDATTMLTGYLFVRWGGKLYDGGDLARKQWQQLRKSLNRRAKAPKTLTS